jgi:hypothetical protein
LCGCGWVVAPFGGFGKKRFGAEVLGVAPSR